MPSGAADVLNQEVPQLPRDGGKLFDRERTQVGGGIYLFQNIHGLPFLRLLLDATL
jgi:hypothetical protein